MSRNAPCPCNSGKKSKLCCLKPRTLIAQPTQLPIDGPGLIVLLPTKGRVTIETVTCLSKLDQIPAVMRTVSRRPVVEARNELALLALKVPEQARFAPKQWYCLWVDDDAFWRAGTVRQAIHTLQEHPNIDLLGGWFCSRTANASPAVRQSDNTWPRPGITCAHDAIVQIHRCGFHFVLHKLDLLNDLPANPFTTEGDDHAEDYAFCRRVREANKTIWVDTGMPVAHLEDDGFAYLPGLPPHIVVDGELLKSEQPKKHTYGFEPQPMTALDLRR